MHSHTHTLSFLSWLLCAPTANGRHTQTVSHKNVFVIRSVFISRVSLECEWMLNLNGTNTAHLHFKSVCLLHKYNQYVYYRNIADTNLLWKCCCLPSGLNLHLSDSFLCDWCRCCAQHRTCNARSTSSLGRELAPCLTQKKALSHTLA